MLSSHSHPLPLIFFVLPVFSLLLSLSKFCFKSLSLKGRLLLLQTPCGLSSFFFMLLFFFPVSVIFFCCFYSICSAPSTYHGRTNSTHAYTENDTHKTYCSSAKWMAGWESQTLCYSIPANAISGDTVPTREPLRGTEAFSEMQTITQAYCYVVPLPSLLLPLQTFFFIYFFISTSWKPQHQRGCMVLCAQTACLHICVLWLFDHANQGWGRINKHNNSITTRGLIQWNHCMMNDCGSTVSTTQKTPCFCDRFSWTATLWCHYDPYIVLDWWGKVGFFCFFFLVMWMFVFFKVK